MTRELGQALGSNTLTLFEPDEKEGKNPYLSDYYQEPSRWALIFQLHMLQARFRMHQHAQWHALQGTGHAVLDRSYMGDTAFAKLQLKNGLMSQREFDTYQSTYQAMTASVLLPNVCIRILVSPEVCAQRIQKRMEAETGRTCESAIDLDYLRGLEKEIDHMVGVLRSQGVAIIDVPWDDDRSTTEARQPVVEALASRIQNLEAPDYFLDLHRRTI